MGNGGSEEEVVHIIGRSCIVGCCSLLLLQESFEAAFQSYQNTGSLVVLTYWLLEVSQLHKDKYFMASSLFHVLRAAQFSSLPMQPRSSGDFLEKNIRYEK